MPTTANKGYSVPTTSSEVGTWGDDINTNSFGVIDSNVGGLYSLSLSASNPTLTSTQAQNCIIRCTGTLLADITVTSACIGFYFVENLTTGAHTVTFTNGIAGVAVPQSTRATLIADGTNGVRIASQAQGFVSGTKQLFFQTAAPTGWTKDTSLNNGTIRMVSGSVGADGGTANFTDVFAARTILQANLPNYNLPVTDPGHLHTYERLPASGTHAQGTGAVGAPTTTDTSTAVTGISVASGGSGTAMDFAVKYADAIRAAVN